ncbi:hypothetical protein [Massilibacterium senegalense]|uniref:hypothetical protein n=1 Tax=Massilibacterium senegalense TaxID=1632858 RepID=UPI0007814258|nr:hypothetical protein [Massilibacterium senegalense]
MYTNEDAAVFAGMMGLFFIGLIIIAVLYIFLALGLYKMAVRENINNPWLAWIPVAQYYTLGELVKHKLGTNAPMILLILGLLNLVLSWIPILGSVYSIAFVIFYIIVMHWLFEKYSTNATIMTVFNAITLSSLSPFFVFAIRNNPNRLENTTW